MVIHKGLIKLVVALFRLLLVAHALPFLLCLHCSGKQCSSVCHDHTVVYYIAIREAMLN